MAKTTTKPAKLSVRTNPVVPINAEQFEKKLKTFQSATELKKYERYFRFSDDKPLKDDTFIGVRMGTVFNLAKAFIEMPVAEIEKLLESGIHEVRAGACSIMGKQAAHRKTTEEHLKKLYNLYLRRHDRINSWDLVDLAAYHVVGRYLEDKPRKVLYKLARSKDPWERRTAIVSTAHFIRKGDVEDTFRISALLLKDDHDLIHKATGWMLRAAGTVDKDQLSKFLDKHAATMPRTTLRAALEHYDKKKREYYMALRKK